jgi:hypothetical protein
LFEFYFYFYFAEAFWNFRQSYLETPNIYPTDDYFFRLIKTNSTNAIQYTNGLNIVSSSFKKIFYDNGIDNKPYFGQVRFDVCVDILPGENINYASFTYLPVFEINVC